MVHLEGLNNSLRQRQVWRLISKISSERERADRNQMTVLATRAFGRGAAGRCELDGTVPGLACLCRCAAGKSVADGGTHKVLCSTDVCAALQQYHPKRHVFGAEVAMKLLSSLPLGCRHGLGVGRCGVSPVPPRARWGAPEQNDRVLRVYRLPRCADRLRQSRLPRMPGAPSVSELRITPANDLSEGTLGYSSAMQRRPRSTTE